MEHPMSSWSFTILEIKRISQKTGLGITGVLSELMGLKPGEVMGALSEGTERERDRKEESEDRREEWKVGER